MTGSPPAKRRVGDGPHYLASLFGVVAGEEPPDLRASRIGRAAAASAVPASTAVPTAAAATVAATSAVPTAAVPTPAAAPRQCGR